MLQVEMSASLRLTSGKGAMRRLRMEGMTPAIVYGGGKEAVALQLESKTLMAKLLEFYRRNTIVKLKVDGKAEKNVLISEVQVDPVSGNLIHVDFFEIDLNKERSFNVPVVYEGIAKGVDLGGVLLIHHEHIVFEGKPLDMPDQCTLDVSELLIGDNIKCGVIVVPENLVMVTGKSEVAVAVVKPGVEKVEDEDEEEGAVSEESEEVIEEAV
ncbi:MAG: 50S ribosomal protein L25 [Desulfobulbaceae bacterium]|nr:50S ribosomal protein L25 [Desulfobulbaceae bacterium]